MKKIDMTNVQATGEFSRPTAGAYICKITDVKDISDREYLKIFYDIDEGEFKGYYTEMRDNHPDWDWAGAYVRSYKETALGMLKRFCNAVSKSNGNYVFDAGKVNADETTLIGKRVGIILQEEEYYGNDGNIRSRLKVFREFPVSELTDQKVPEPKKLPRTAPADESNSAFVSAGTDEEVPF